MRLTSQQLVPARRRSPPVEELGSQSACRLHADKISRRRTEAEAEDQRYRFGRSIRDSIFSRKRCAGEREEDGEGAEKKTGGPPKRSTREKATRNCSEPLRDQNHAARDAGG